MLIFVGTYEGQWCQQDFQPSLRGEKCCYPERSKALVSSYRKLKNSRHDKQKYHASSVQDGDLNHSFLETAYIFPSICRYLWENLSLDEVFNIFIDVKNLRHENLNDNNKS